MIRLPCLGHLTGGARREAVLLKVLLYPVLMFNAASALRVLVLLLQGLGVDGVVSGDDGGISLEIWQVYVPSGLRILLGDDRLEELDLMRVRRGDLAHEPGQPVVDLLQDLVGVAGLLVGELVLVGFSLDFPEVVVHCQELGEDLRVRVHEALDLRQLELPHGLIQQGRGLLDPTEILITLLQNLEDVSIG